METPEGARSFITTGSAYDAFMGRYSRPLAVAFADAAGISSGQQVVDIGCGPGALTGVLVDRLGASSVWAFDPSAPFVEACSTRHPGVDVRLGRAEEIPFEDRRFDGAMAQLVLHFMSDPEQAAREMLRVLRPGGVVAGCVWDFEVGMQMLRAFWDAALVVDPDAPDEARALRFGRQGEIVDLFSSAGFVDVTETTLVVTSTYRDFAELWSGFLAGIGPAGAYCTSLAEDGRQALRDALYATVGSPSDSFALQAVARCVTARAPL